MFGLEFPRLYNLSAHVIPHVTYFPLRQGFWQTCYLGKPEGKFVTKNFKVGDKKHTTHFKGWWTWLRRWRSVYMRWPWELWEICLSEVSDKDSFWSDFTTSLGSARSSSGAPPFEVGLLVKAAAHVNPQIGYFWAWGRTWHTWKAVNQRSMNSTTRSWSRVFCIYLRHTSSWHCVVIEMSTMVFWKHM